ncbi:hypothetical protein [Vulgatibacter incomptus]|uniref:Uncharacterized protein n=1 Tax=Vulgatibacter incomptus TaxID=1391653 RepID=A0A0K1PBG8_9BACT|nr:hypothetical protein [Vulgatibacter incomptus]AKU90746.1 hypothetical protein AKJ08_1133 [Vulgatibacter incomptus]
MAVEKLGKGDDFVEIQLGKKLRALHPELPPIWRVRAAEKIAGDSSRKRG